MPAVIPEEVYQRMEIEMGAAGSNFQFATFLCRSVRIGSYQVTNQNVGHDLRVDLTELGLKFSLPLANFKRKIMKVCIPKESIVSMKVHFSKRLQVIFIKTGPKYGKWIRSVLRLDGSPTNENSNYYCPLDGKPRQQIITFIGDYMEESDISLVKKHYAHALQEINFPTANDILMNIAPRSKRSSFESSSSADPSLKTVKIEPCSPTVSATSKGEKRMKSAEEQTLPTNKAEPCNKRFRNK